MLSYISMDGTKQQITYEKSNDKHTLCLKFWVYDIKDIFCSK